jgi:hypothetical protein
VLAANAPFPIAVLFDPDVLAAKALTPTAVFVATELAPRPIFTVLTVSDDPSNVMFAEPPKAPALLYWT